MNKIEISIVYRKFDFTLTLFDYNGECEVFDYTIELDYCFDKPWPSDDMARLVVSMLADGDHLKEKIFDYVNDDHAQWDSVCQAIWQSMNNEKRDYIDGEGDYNYNFMNEEIL